MDSPYKKYIFFRDDDVSSLTKNLECLLDIFISTKVPLHLSVIPNKLTKECKEFISHKINKYRNLFEIGQHGFAHEDHSGHRNKKKKYEFGPKRDYLEQRKDIDKGKKALERYFKQRINVFTPPWHGYDKNTLKSITDADIPIISIDHKSQVFNALHSIKNIPVSINFNRLTDNGSWFTEDKQEVLKKIFSMHDQTVGILLHHNKFSNQNEFFSLNNLIDVLKKTKLIEFIPLTRALDISKPKNKSFRNALLYYLTYQFVPKPLTIMKNHTNKVHKDYDYSYISKTEIINYEESIIKKNLYKQLKETIMKQLPDTNKSIGLLLSGGIDSAAILSVLRDLTSRRIFTLTGAYHKNAKNLALANKLAKQFNTIHEDLIIEPKELRKIDEIYKLGNMPQPIGDDGLLSFYLMIQKLKKRCNIIFAGDGADCLFSGLKMHLVNLKTKKIKNESNEFEHYKFGDIFLSQKELKLFFKQRHGVFDQAAPLRSVCNEILEKSALKRQVLIDLNFLVKNRIDYLIYPAKICNVILNLPFLDKKFVDFALKIPYIYLIKDKQQKHILRQAFEGKLPREIISREKEGFTPPFRLWFELNREFIIRKLIESVRFGIPKDYVKYLISVIPRSNDRHIGMKIWLIINLTSWHSSLQKK